MNTISIAKALSIVGAYLLKTEEEFATAMRNSENLEMNGDIPYRIGFMSYTIFANEDDAISISSSANFFTVFSYFTSPDTRINQINKTEEFFCFSKKSYDKAKAGYQFAHRGDIENVTKWIDKKLFLVTDYEQQKTYIKKACKELNWYSTHSALGDLKLFGNRNHYHRILDYARQWTDE